MTDVDVGNSNWNDMEHVLPEGIGHGDPTRTGTTGTSWSWARRRRGASLVLKELCERGAGTLAARGAGWVFRYQGSVSRVLRHSTFCRVNGVRCPCHSSLSLASS